MWLELQALLLAVPNKIIGMSITLAAVALVFVWAERKFPLHPQKTLRKSWLVDVGYFYIGAIVPGFFLLLLMHLTTALLSPLGPMPWYAWVADLSAPTAFVASTLLAEIAYYWAHRLAHQIPFFWRFHSIHHSAPHVDWLVNTRAHPLDLSFMRGFIFVCMYVLGFGRGMSESQAMANTIFVTWMTIWAYVVHANIRLPLRWLEYVVSSPHFHHWHHVKGEPALVDKNYAATMPWVDMLFGTFYLPKNEWPKQYGIDDELSPGLWGQLLDPLRGRRARQIGLTAWGRAPQKPPAKITKRPQKTSATKQPIQENSAC
jgi:sterol desaturase/sphingolipid hydroxylase (fatty acid hydroxylase superfamily)